MATKNDITGDPLVTKSANDAYRDGWERIFGKKKKSSESATPTGEEPVRDTPYLTPEQKQAIADLTDHIDPKVKKMVQDKIKNK